MMTEPALDQLREQIDRIDDQLHDLLMERAAIVQAIGERKGQTGSAVIHPGREARILRRLAGRHHGPLSFAVIARLWRELISACTQLQGPLAIAAFAADDRALVTDLVRDHFGSQVPIALYRSISQVIRSVSEKRANIGVLPMPQENEADPWWHQLVSRDSAAPRIIGRLPFAGRGNARSAGDILAIASHIGEIADFDRSFLVIEVGGPMSRTRLTGALAQAGFAGGILAVSDRDGPVLALVEIQGPVEGQDPRLVGLAGLLGEPLGNIYHLGGYAEPLSLA